MQQPKAPDFERDVRLLDSLSETARRLGGSVRQGDGLPSSVDAILKRIEQVAERLEPLVADGPTKGE